MKSEYIACSATVQEVVWLQRFFRGLGITESAKDPIMIHSYSMGSLAYAKDLKYHGRTKHNDIHYHFVRDMIVQQEVVLEHIFKSQMIVDPLTKPIPRDTFKAHVRSMELRRFQCFDCYNWTIHI